MIYVIDAFSKHAWVVPLKDKKRPCNAFQKLLDESNHCVVDESNRCIAKSETRKSNKLGVDKGSEFSNTSMKSW